MLDHLTRETFADEAYIRDIPVLVCFGAERCPHCVAQFKALDSVAELVGDLSKIYLVNPDDQPELAALFGVTRIPSTVKIRNGMVEEMAVGLMPSEDILAMLKR